MSFIPVSPKYNSLSAVGSYYCVRLVSNRECLAPVAGIAEHYKSAEVSKDMDIHDSTRYLQTIW